MTIDRIIYDDFVGSIDAEAVRRAFEEIFKEFVSLDLTATEIRAREAEKKWRSEDTHSLKDYSARDFKYFAELKSETFRPAEPKTLRERERAHWTSLNARGKKWMK